ncbi:MAG: cell division protein FtsB [Variovorax sp.]
MRMRAVPIILLALLAILQYQLWFGRGSVPEVTRLKDNIEVQTTANLRASQTNERLASEVNDLQDGTEMVEERARLELGMVKPNEVLVQVGK